VTSSIDLFHSIARFEVRVAEHLLLLVPSLWTLHVFSELFDQSRLPESASFPEVPVGTAVWSVTGNWQRLTKPLTVSAGGEARMCKLCSSSAGEFQVAASK
jgi:hypothetical protein